MNEWTKKKGAISRADLVELGLDLSDEPSLLDLKRAGALGYDWTAPEPVVTTVGEDSGDADTETTSAVLPKPDHLSQVPFLCPVWFQETAPKRESEVDSARPKTSAKWLNRPTAAPEYVPLADPYDLALRVSRLVSNRQNGRKPDLPRWTKQLAKLEVTNRIPRRQASSLPEKVQVVLDRSLHLTPIWEDQIQLLKESTSVFGAIATRPLVYDAASAALTDPGLAGAPASLDPADGPVLALSDLGTFSGSTQFWKDLGEEISLSGGIAAALLPCKEDLIDEDLQKFWRLGVWSSESQDYLEEDLDLLLTLVSPAIRIEPGLLRAMRSELMPFVGPEVEVALWSSSHLSSQNSTAATLRPDSREAIRKKFLSLSRSRDRDKARRALEIIRQWRAQTADEVWFEEIVDLPAEQRPLVHEDDLAHALAFWHDMRALTQDPEKLDLDGSDAAWLRRVGKRTLEHGGLAEPALRDAVLAAFKGRLEDAPLIAAGLGPEPTEKIGKVSVAQKSTALEIGKVSINGSAIAVLDSDDGVIELLSPEQPPFPGARFDIDGFGKLLAFDVNGVEVRLRWCPPGAFKMGSLKEEPGRDSNEGPQVDMIIEEGFWMMETPVTQALYEAVTGQNPSYFKSPDRPVETVSWKEAKNFVEKLNARIPGAELYLPSEAQWEFACRAGTDTALWTGPIEIEGFNNASALDPIAWYGGNSGIEFDLDNGVASRSWPEKQYPHSRAGTRPVMQKRANPWGLYDTLGNVWEWCDDVWSDGHEGASTNGSARQVSPQDGEQSRVLRGGSWYDYARGCRAASRLGYVPEDRDDFIGIRLARGQARAQAGRAERATRRNEAGREAEPRSARSGGPIQLLLDRLIATGDHQPALERAQKEVETAETNVSATVQSLGLGLIGLAGALLGSSKTTQALKVAESAVRYLSDLTDNAEQYVLANALAHLSLAQLGAGKPEEALQVANRSVTIHQELNLSRDLRAGLTNALGAQVASLLALGRTKEVREVAQQIVDLALQGDPDQTQKNVLAAVSAALFALDRVIEARDYAERAIDRVGEVADRDADDLASGPFFGLLSSNAILVETLKATIRGFEVDPLQRHQPLKRGRVTTSKAARLTLPEGPFVIKTDRAELMVSRLTLDDLAWAKAAGRDRFGLWATCKISEQKMRWIPPGQFLMGSPESEEGRYEDEGPQVPVTLSRGYWLADAPVTVAQFRRFIENIGHDTGQGAYGWTGTEFGFSENLNWQDPGFDQEESAPVTCVNWYDASAFAAWLNDGRSDNEVWHLPSEACWEYACRAGTNTAVWTGKLQIPGANIAPDLDPLAWYGGNSGLGYEGKRGVDSTDWPEKQYDHAKAGTQAVRGKAGNPWGLYDTLGNVWEWCDDVWSDGHEGASTNGSARQVSQQDGGQVRVLRGGSWSNLAGYCRAASRRRFDPERRYDNIGIRLARGQARAQASQGAERPPRPAGSERAAEPPPDPKGLGDHLRSILGFAGGDKEKDN